MKPTVGNDVDVRLAEKLAQLGRLDNRGTRRAARLLAYLNATPMEAILAKVPGDSVIEKANRVGVSRQTFYYWLKGVTRPNIIQAKKLRRITGYELDVIRGLT